MRRRRRRASDRPAVSVSGVFPFRRNRSRNFLASNFALCKVVFWCRFTAIVMAFIRMPFKCESSLETVPFPHVSSGCDLRFFPHRPLDPEQDCRPLVIGLYVHRISPCPAFREERLITEFLNRRPRLIPRLLRVWRSNSSPTQIRCTGSIHPLPHVGAVRDWR